MKSSKSEIVYFVLSIMVLSVAAFIYVVFGNQHQVKQAQNLPLVAKSAKQVKEKPENIRLAEDYLANLDTDLTQDNLETAQAAIDVVEDPASKESLQNQLNTFSKELENQKKAEEALVQAEAIITQENINTAQASIDTLIKENKKAELQTRLDAVKAILASWVQPAYQ